MKILKLALLILVTLTATSCFEDRDDNAVSASEINDFVWKGMNAFYLYKDNIDDLSNTRFSSNEDYADYLNGFSDPQELFNSLIYMPETVDEFSILIPNYLDFEQLLSGTTVSNGMEFGLFRFSATDTNIYGIVRYVLPNTSAEDQGVQRGDIFYGVNGTQITTENASSLLFSNSSSYSINIGAYEDNGTPNDVNDDSVSPTTTTIVLNKTPYTENPIFINDVLNVDGNNVGYLMYNAFTGTNTFDSQLNTTFGQFQAAGITDLILDLRYNGGGSVNTAIWLSSMITGQFTGDTMFTEEYNSDLQALFENNDPESLINPFVNEMVKRNSNGDVLFQETINHLNLNTVYVLTSGSSASASELVINSLSPYIDVVQIGTNTRGKFQASTTLYDSENFRRTNANPNHTYALQPLIFKSVNINGITDYTGGLSPDVEFPERVRNYGVLGDVTEPLLAAAIATIEGSGRFSQSYDYNIKYYKGSKDFVPFSTEMYVESDDTMFPLRFE